MARNLYFCTKALEIFSIEDLPSPLIFQIITNVKRELSLKHERIFFVLLIVPVYKVDIKDKAFT